MIKEYFQFFNTIKSADITSSQVLESFGRFILEKNDSFVCGFYGVVENGYYTTHFFSKETTSPQCSLPMLTHDIHQEIYNMSPLSLYAGALKESFPFLSMSSFKQIEAEIDKHFSTKCSLTYVIMHFYHHHYLINSLCFVSTATESVLQSQKETYQFIRHNIEDMLTPYLFQADIKNAQLLSETAHSMINTSRYSHSDKRTLMAQLLDLAFELLDEPDYGSALLFENGQWNFIHTIGHDLEKLSKFKLPEELHKNPQAFWKKISEVAPNIFLIDHILNIEYSSISEQFKALMEQIKTVSLPISQTIQLHFSLNGTLLGIISLDKKMDSHAFFTRKTIHTLTQINFLGQTLLTYATLSAASQSFEELTDLISRLIVPASEDKHSFLPSFLALLVDRLYEVEYASAYIRDQQGIHFLATIGHDLHALQKIPLKQEYFLEHHQNRPPMGAQSYTTKYENPNITTSLFTNLIKSSKSYMPDDIFEQFFNASQPIKDALIAESKLDDNVFMSISVDIPKNSDLSFSKNSIHLFKSLINLGFSFISNQYYIDKYKLLNTVLEDTVKERTQELEKSNRKLKDIAKKDSLTGLLNHKYIIQRLNRSIARQQQLSMFLFDIDHFKDVNDIYGHQVGDHVLVGISQLLQKDTHILSGRYGGEEFMVLLPGMDLSDAIIYCQSLLFAIETAPFIPNRPITVSGGLVTHKKSTSTELIQVADALLYKAKAAGRNRIESSYS